MAISGQIRTFHLLTDGRFRAVLWARTCRKSFDSEWACMKASSRGWPRGSRMAQRGRLGRRAGLAAVGALAMLAAMTTPQLAQAAQASVRSEEHTSELQSL